MKATAILPVHRLASGPSRTARITHTEHLPPRAGRHAVWPDRIRPEVIAAIQAGRDRASLGPPGRAADHALDGDSVVVATGTASGKSLAYLVPVLSTLLDGSEAPNGRGATALYLAPTKALAADQCRSVRELAQPLGTAVRPAVYDGDTPFEEREWVRQYANYVLTNPDMLHRGILPSHARWASFLRRCGTSSSTSATPTGACSARTSPRCCADCADCAPATARAGLPARLGHRRRARRGRPPADRCAGREVADDASPRGELVFALWEPPLTELHGEKGAPVRRTATAETAELLADLVVQGVHTVAFVRSRRGAELISVIAQERLAEVDRSLRRVAAYRGGYLPEERRALERALHSGELLGLAATTALELGVDVSGLDAVLIAGCPGTRASLWQQAGRAGRTGQGALAVLVARDDPLDTYLVHHPEAMFERPWSRRCWTRTTRTSSPRTCAPPPPSCPLTEDDLALFGPAAPMLLPQLEAAKLLRRRHRAGTGHGASEPPTWPTSAGAGGPRCRSWRRAPGGCWARSTPPPRTPPSTRARSTCTRAAPTWCGRWTWRTPSPWSSRPTRHYSTVPATPRPSRCWRRTPRSRGATAAVLRLRRGHQPGRLLPAPTLITGEVLGETKLDLPPRTLRTRAVWWTVTEDQLDAARIDPEILGGALHAAEHASIGLLPLFATCDRWDIGGVSIPLHPDTCCPRSSSTTATGGAGFAERAFPTARAWLTATREAIASCECDAAALPASSPPSAATATSRCTSGGPCGS